MDTEGESEYLLKAKSLFQNKCLQKDLKQAVQWGKPMNIPVLRQFCVAK